MLGGIWGEIFAEREFPRPLAAILGNKKRAKAGTSVAAAAEIASWALAVQQNSEMQKQENKA